MLLDLVDAWTVGHMGFGLIAALLTKKFWKASFVFAFWEFMEHGLLSEIVWWGDPSWMNGVADILVAQVTMYAALLVRARVEPRLPPWFREAVEE